MNKKYTLNVKNAASTLISELKSAMEVEGTKVHRMVIESRTNKFMLWRNESYDIAVTKQQCYKMLYDRALDFLTRNPALGPSNKDISKFIETVEYCYTVIDMRRDFVDPRLAIWNSTIDSIKSTWLSYRTLVGDTTITDTEKETILIPYGLAY